MEREIPFSIQTSLEQDGLIPKLFSFETPDSNFQILNGVWVAESELVLSKEFLKNSFFEIQIPKIDGQAKIYLNDSLVGIHNSSFRPFTKNISGLVNQGNNKLKIELINPVDDARKAAGSQDYTFPNPMGGTSWSPNSFLRKPGFHFGWDWVPAFNPIGIYGSPKIMAWSEARITNISAMRRGDSNSLNVEIESNGDKSAILSVELDSKTYKKSVSLKNGLNMIDWVLPELSLDHWRPYSRGGQKLYEVKASLSQDLVRVDEYSQILGINNISLVQKKDSIGKSFQFEESGEPIFIRGANYVPLNVFLDRVESQDYKKFISRIKEGGFNMIRVWGGGLYERDEFYSICDKEGIMVWQDLMFANTLYPWHENFQMEVEKEIIYQVGRLRSHPCIALWCGNNEIETAWKNWGWSKELSLGPGDSLLYLEKYRALFEKRIPDLLAELDPGRSYLPSSPSSNWAGKENFNQGNIHDWAVWHGEEPIGIWQQRTARFNSEFGMQSFPSMDLLKAYGPDSLYLGHPYLSERQRAPKGMERLNSYLRAEYRRPRSLNHLIFLSQSHQALAIGSAAEYMRSQQPRNMGFMVWQANDCWPGISWSIMDFSQDPKPAYFSLKRANQEIILTGRVEGGKASFQGVNNSGKNLLASLVIERVNFFGRVNRIDSSQVKIKEKESAELATIPIRNLVEEGKGRWNLLRAKLYYQGEMIASKLLFLERPRALWLKDPEIEIGINAGDTLGYEVSLTSKFLAKDVWLSSKSVPGNFSDNHFDLIPGEPKRLFFYPEGKPNGNLTIEVKSLNDYR